MSTGGSYDPHAIEADIYRFWESGGHFRARVNPDRRPYVIDIPLPNITGALHIGHALNNTIQDMLIRHARMRGFETLWMPGTDHAGIATQAVVERKLKEEQGLTRHELGREGLVQKIWEWRDEYGDRILNQLRALGASCDWERTRFTLDEVCAKAVYEVFFQWFRQGLIYRGLRLVNWDAFLQTAVADDEVIYEKVKGHFWHFRYPILAEKDGKMGRWEGGQGVPDDVARAAIERATRPDARLGVDYMAIATTRPETMLGDTALCVHPSDERYRHVVGRHVLLPLQNRAIPIIADGQLAKIEMGTGCVKVTPGHDPKDYQCGLRNKLPMVNILTPDGRINEHGGAYRGQTKEAARKAVVADLEKLGLVERIEDYETEVGHSDRSKTPIEPMLSEQWFVKMAGLAERAMEAVRDGRVRFFPERYANTYLDWLGEKRDWCISRQLWWGHRIPVWRPSLTEIGKLTGEEWASGMRDVMSLERAQSDQIVIRIADDAPREVKFADGLRGHVRNVLVCLRNPQHADIANLLQQAGFERDPDVLDTWFSSALWPLSTLGWPDDYGKGSRARGIEGSREEAARASPSIPRSLDPLIPDLDYFYPTTVLVTAREIITLWVARMVITGLHFTGRVPFAHVHIHPNIQDGQGRRMSKSAGNGVDPLDIIHLYGTDALRFTMVQLDSETQDARLPVQYLCPHCHQSMPQLSEHLGKATVKCRHCKKVFATRLGTAAQAAEHGLGIASSERFEMGRNFCNKIWQAATGFVFPNIGAPGSPVAGGGSPAGGAIEDRWILSRLAHAIERVDDRYARYQLNDVAATLYDFFWGDFCDWYVELVKPRLYSAGEGVTGAAAGDAGPGPRASEPRAPGGDSAAAARQVLAFVLDQSLRLMHPVLPFITEALWQQLNALAPRRGVFELFDGEPALIRAAWPDASKLPRDDQVEREMAALQQVIRALRDTLARINVARSQRKQPAIGKLPRAVIRPDPALATGLAAQTAVLERLGRCERVEVGPDLPKPPESATQVLAGVEIHVPLAGLMDLAAERQRLMKERDELRGHIQRLAGKLGNADFVSKAPPAVVEQERARVAEMQSRLSVIDRNLAELG